MIDCAVFYFPAMQHSIGYVGDGFYRSKDPTNRLQYQSTERKTVAITLRVDIRSRKVEK